MNEQREITRIREALSERRRDSFAPGFADRATARWRSALADGRLGAVELTLGSSMSKYFRRVVPLAAAAALLLAAYNVRHRTTGQSVLASLFGPPATATLVSHAATTTASMRSLDELYDLGVPSTGGNQ